jgi:L-2-hydroxyglutarate oxidase LhgO
MPFLRAVVRACWGLNIHAIMNCDVIVVGGGIVGLATSLRLIEARPGLRLLLLEKESTLGAHQTGNNSGVLHAGLYYKPGSAKARMAVQGLQSMLQFCRDHDIAHETCGKIVVATSQDELSRLDLLWERGHANGLQGLQRLSPGQIREMEPHATGLGAIRVPQEGIVDYPAVARKMGELICRQGGEIRLGVRVRRLIRKGGVWTAESNAGEFHGRFVITCAGLHSDRLVRSSGMRARARIVPFRGEYFKLRADRQHLVRNLVYPVPDPRYPFLGVHFTRLIHGGVEAGPNAVLAFAREGYRWTTVHARDLVESATYPGLWRFLGAHPAMCGSELMRSISRTRFCHSLQQLVPEIQPGDLEPGGAGVRAQAMTVDGRLVEDFCFEEGEGILHVVNAPSPAATASLELGAHIASRAMARMGWLRRRPGKAAGFARGRGRLKLRSAPPRSTTPAA